jgi:CrcB protein
VIPRRPAFEILLVAVGVTLGASLRWAVTATGAGAVATLVANVAGCAAAGAAAARVAPRWRPFWLTGVAGGLSTLSAVGVEVEALLGEGRWVTAAGYVAVSIAGGLTAVRLAGGR